MRSLINNLSINKTYLHKLALQLIQDLIETASKDSSVAISLIAQLTGKHGNLNFDKITKTKTIDSIIGTLKVEGIKSYINYLRNIFLDQDSFEADTKKVEAHRTWVVDQLVFIIKNQKLPKDNEVYLNIFEFLFINGFCVVEKESKKTFTENLKVLPKPEVSEKTQELCRSRFLTVLGESLNSPALANSEEEAPSTQLLQIIDKLNSAKNVKFLTELDKEAKAAKTSAKSTLNSINKKLSEATDKEEIIQLKAFESLLVHLVILIHSDAAEAISNIDDIVNCYIRIFPTENKKSKKNASKDENEEEEANPIEVLVDVLLSFLLKPSLLLRNLTEKVFKAFCSKLTKNAITLIVNVLNPEENENIIEENDDEDNMDVDGEDDDIVMEDGDDDDDDLDIEEDDNDEEVDEELRRKIQAVLQKKDPNNAGELDEEEEELPDLNDDEMLDFDEKLAEIFKQRKIIKNSRRDSKQQILHFKFKVLEMLDIFIKKQSANVLVLELVMPLLHLVKQFYGSHDQQQLFERVQSLLKNRLLKIKDYPKTNVNTEELFDLLEEVNKFAEKCNEPELCNLAGEASIFIAKVILGNNIKKEVTSTTTTTNNKKSKKSGEAESTPANATSVPVYDEKIVKRLSKFYGELLEKFMTKNHTNLRPGQFTVVIQRFPMIAWEFVDTIVEHLSPKPLPNSNAIKVFQLSQAYRFLEILFNTLSKQDEEKYIKKIKSIIPKINAAQAEVCEAYQQTINVKDDSKDKDNGNGERKITKISQQRLKDIAKSLNNISRKVKKVMKDDTTHVIDTTQINTLRSSKSK
jgi:DNA polymerase phi